MQDVGLPHNAHLEVMQCCILSLVCFCQIIAQEYIEIGKVWGGGVGGRNSTPMNFNGLDVHNGKFMAYT